MPYPVLADAESNANQLGVSYWPALAWSALNGVLLVNGNDWVGFQNGINATWAQWTSPNQNVLSPNLPVDIYYAFATDMGRFPSSPNELLSWAQGANLVTRQGQLLTTPQVGFGYPPGSGQNMNGTPTQNPTTTTTATPPPAGPNPFDFGSFLGALAGNPMTAISTYPGAAAVVGIGALFLFKQSGFRL